jgi:hypothetical protein
MTAEPTSERDWTIHSINIHGVFFERRCQKTVADNKDWKLKLVNYPVEFPPPNGPLRGKESTLDIRAECHRQDRCLTLLIECKKNNPELVNWVFFPKYSVPSTSSVIVEKIDNTPHPAAPGWAVTAKVQRINSSLVATDEARETRGDYHLYKNDRSKTKTSNAAIHEAAHQVALATKAISHQDANFSLRLGSAAVPPPMPWKEQVFLPAIVTSAHLFTCDFDPADVDHETGEIPYEKATLTKHPWLVFEYPLPRHLQSEPADLVATLTQNSLDMFTTMNIFVIHSKDFAQVLTELATMADNFFS